MKRNLIRILSLISAATLLVGCAPKNPKVDTQYTDLVRSTSKEAKESDIIVRKRIEIFGKQINWIKKYESGEILTSAFEVAAQKGQKYNVDGKTEEACFGSAAIYEDTEKARAVIDGINACLWDLKDGKSYPQSRVVVLEGENIYDFMYSGMTTFSSYDMQTEDRVIFSVVIETIDKDGNIVYKDGGYTREFNCNNCILYACPEKTNTALERAEEKLASSKLN